MITVGRVILSARRNTLLPKRFCRKPDLLPSVRFIQSPGAKAYQQRISTERPTFDVLYRLSGRSGVTNYAIKRYGTGLDCAGFPVVTRNSLIRKRLRNSDCADNSVAQHESKAVGGVAAGGHPLSMWSSDGSGRCALRERGVITASALGAVAEGSTRALRVGAIAGTSPKGVTQPGARLNRA